MPDQIKPRNTVKIIKRKVLDAYFATKTSKKEYETKTIKHTVGVTSKSSSLSAIAKEYKGVSWKGIQKENKMGSSTTIHSKQVLNITTKVEKKGEKVTFKRLKAANLGDEVYIIVETLKFQGKLILINIKQGKAKGIVEKDKAIQIIQNNKETVLIETTVGKFAKDDKVSNKDDFKDCAIAKVILAPKTVKTLKTYTDILEKLTNKKTQLYLLIDAHSKSGIRPIYNGLNPDKDGEPDDRTTPNYWLDFDGKWFELGGCECCNFNVDSDGFVNHSKITKEHVTEIEQGSFSDSKKSIKNIILHRTVTSSARKTIDNGFKKKRGGVYYGTHFLVGKDGKIFQCASLKKYTYHVTGYNSKSIGIEVVGEPYDKDNKITKGYPDGNPVDHWDSLPTVQAESVACVVKGLLKYYGLKKSGIKNHEDLQAKAKDEGKTVYDVIINLLK